MPPGAFSSCKERGALRAGEINQGYGSAAGAGRAPNAKWSGCEKLPPVGIFKGVVYEYADTSRTRKNDFSKDERASWPSSIGDATEQHHAASRLWPYHPELFEPVGFFPNRRPGNRSDLLIGTCGGEDRRA